MMNDNPLQLKHQKNVLVKELFIDSGDEDYIIARWCLLNQLSRQFFWNTAQSIEKYLKAALLLNGYCSKSYGHDLVRLFDKASSFAGDLIPRQLEAPKQIKLFTDHEKLWGDPTTRGFVIRVKKHGHPSNRYNFFGFVLEASDLYKLDQVVFALRNITVKLDDIIDTSDSNEPTNIGKTYSDLIHEHPNRQLFGFGEFLLNSKKTTQFVYDAAYENNFPFAPKFNHRELELRIHSNVSRLEILFSKSIHADSAAILNWVDNNIQLSEKDKTILNEHFSNLHSQRK